MRNNSDMKPAPQINKKSENIMKKKGKYIPLYKRAIDIQNEKKFNYAVMLETKKTNELNQKYSTSNITFSKEEEKKFFYNQIRWKKDINKKTANLRCLLNSRNEESLTQNSTFKPKLTERTILLANKKRINKSNDNSNVFIRLYKENEEKEKSLKKLQKKYTPNFQPIIYDKSPNRTTKIHNINKRNKNINYKINTSRTNYNNKKRVVYVEEELSLDSYPSLFINESIIKAKNKHNSKVKIIQKNNPDNLKKKLNKESYISNTTEIGTDRNKNNFIPVCSTKVTSSNQDPNSRVDRQYVRHYSDYIKNPKKIKNYLIANNKISLKNGKFDNECKTDRIIIGGNNINYNNNDVKVELWTVDDIGENLSAIKREESWVEKLKNDSLNFKDVLNENKQEMVEDKEKNKYEIKNNNLFSINLNNIDNSCMNNQLRPSIIKGKQNIFYKYFKKKN